MRNKMRIVGIGALVLLAAIVETPATKAVAADSGGASDLPLPAREFNSKLALEVFLAPPDDSPFSRPVSLGRTPAAMPLTVPAGRWWYVIPDSTVDRQLLVQEMNAQRIPGLLLLYGASDSDLALLKDLRDLRFLIAPGPGVTDAGLEHLKGLTSLQWLYLNSINVTDAGLEHLKGLSSLQRLDLTGTQVTDAGLEYLKGLTALHSLDLTGTKVRGAGLEHLQGLTALQSLDLGDTNMTNAGLEHLQGLTALQTLDLGIRT